MNTVEAKSYANQRFAELTKDYLQWHRVKKTNLIIEELARDHNFVVVTPTGQQVRSIQEDNLGIIYNIDYVMR